jgi:sterol desaturase/sphingolipid hydroxylase (fatty acid hydroxylase superfamily)
VIEFFFDFHSRIHPLYLAAALLLAVALFGKKTRRFMRPSLWRSQSAQTDYLYFVVIFAIKALVIVPLLFSATEVALATARLLEALFGYVPLPSTSRTTVALWYTLALFVAGDFSRYWLHRWMHTVPFLWRFHKVHHSATRLTPFSFYRIHPLESFLFGLRYAIVAGAVTGIFLYLFKANVHLADILGVNAFLFLAHILGDNLRHSHVPLGYWGWLERILISPRQHQVHHARNVTLQNSNYGGVLAVWDALFGTLRLSKTAGAFYYGYTKTHINAWQLLILPFYKGL